MSRMLASIMSGENVGGARLTAEQEDAYAYWSEPPYWNFLTGTWPLKGTKTRPAVPVWWTLDQDLHRERPMPSKGYEYARDGILTPIFCWKPGDDTDRESWWVNKSRKVLGTLWVLSGAGAEVIFKDGVSWRIAKGKREEAQELIVERLRFAINHQNYPEWLRRYRPVRPRPIGRFARYAPGSPAGVYKSLLAPVGQNFGTKEAKGWTTDFIIDEAPELEGLRGAAEAARPGARRMVFIGTPPEPNAKGKRIDMDSVAYFREAVHPELARLTPVRRHDDVDMTGVGDDDDDPDDDSDADMIGAR